jgi:hypothetical protein
VTLQSRCGSAVLALVLCACGGTDTDGAASQPGAVCAPACPEGATCLNGVCVAPIEPAEVCSPACPEWATCLDAVCVAPICVPQCAGRQCGDDGCGGSCGWCELGATCDSAAVCRSYSCPAGSACVVDGQERELGTLSYSNGSPVLYSARAACFITLSGSSSNLSYVQTDVQVHYGSWDCTGTPYLAFLGAPISEWEMRCYPVNGELFTATSGVRLESMVGFSRFVGSQCQAGWFSTSAPWLPGKQVTDALFPYQAPLHVVQK